MPEPAIETFLHDKTDNFFFGAEHESSPHGQRGGLSQWLEPLRQAKQEADSNTEITAGSPTAAIDADTIWGTLCETLEAVRDPLVEVCEYGSVKVGYENPFLFQGHFDAAPTVQAVIPQRIEAVPNLPLSDEVYDH